MKIGNRRISDGHGCFIIAEAGVNHNGDPELAAKLIDAAAEAGADAVKFQVFRADRVAARSAPKARYQAENVGAEGSQFDMIEKLELGFPAFRRLADHAARRGILFFATPFDLESLDFLVSLPVPLLKIPSGEIDNFILLRRAAATRLPLIVSTGMSTLADIDQAVRACQAAGSGDLALLHCTSNYPAAPEAVNLRAMDAMAAAFQLPVGYSDHTLGIEIALAARARGAAILEKHFTLDRTMPGPDHRASLEPGELAQMVRGIRLIDAALGDGLKRPHPSEEDTRKVARRSLVACRDLPAGTVLAFDDLDALRPAGGIGPAMVDLVVGRRIRRAMTAGEAFAWGDLAEEG